VFIFQKNKVPFGRTNAYATAPVQYHLPISHRIGDTSTRLYMIPVKVWRKPLPKTLLSTSDSTPVILHGDEPWWGGWCPSFYWPDLGSGGASTERLVRPQMPDSWCEKYIPLGGMVLIANPSMPTSKSKFSLTSSSATEPIEAETIPRPVPCLGLCGRSSSS
jgi:hypothetical protein